MTRMLSLFVNNLLPVLLAVGAGYLAARYLHVNPRHISRITFYIFSPFLIFDILVKSELSNGDIFRMFLFTSVTLALVGLLTWLAGRMLRFDRQTMAAVMITSMFMNSGNFGLAVVLFGFGEFALAYASVFFVTNAILVYTVGVVIISLGRVSIREALVNLVKIPTIYAILLAVLFMYTGWQLPLPLERTTSLLGAASIPTMLILLGMQLQSVQFAGRILPLGLATFMRLIVSPLVALLVVVVFKVPTPFRQAGVLQSAMPSAVLSTVLATEYDVKPRFVTAVVLTTTLLSLFTLTPLMAFLGG